MQGTHLFGINTEQGLVTHRPLFISPAVTRVISVRACFVTQRELRAQCSLCGAHYSPVLHPACSLESDKEICDTFC